MDNEVHIARRDKLAQGWHRLEKVTLDYRRKSGERQRLERELYDNGSGAGALLIDPTRRCVMLVRQFRVAALLHHSEPFLLEACGGMVEEGEDPAACVRKEVAQELGYALRDIESVGRIFPSPGCTSERVYLFLARYDPSARCGNGGGLRSEGEEIEPVELSYEEAWRMVAAGEIVDAKTVLLLQLLRIRDLS